VKKRTKFALWFIGFVTMTFFVLKINGLAVAKSYKNLPIKLFDAEPNPKIPDMKKRGRFTKVIGSEIIRKLDRGESYVDVIVLLNGYKNFKGKIIADKPVQMAKMQSKIRGLQRIVLNKVHPSGFKLKHKFENIPGFSATITREGLEALESMPEVEIIEEDKIAHAHLAQGITWHRV
jgi:hypothetical protein